MNYLIVRTINYKEKSNIIILNEGRGGVLREKLESVRILIEKQLGFMDFNFRFKNLVSIVTEQQESILTIEDVINQIEQSAQIIYISLEKNSNPIEYPHNSIISNLKHPQEVEFTARFKGKLDCITFPFLFEDDVKRNEKTKVKDYRPSFISNCFF